MEDPLAAPPFAGGGMAAAASSALCGLPLFADCCNAAGPSASATASLANGISGEGFLLNAYGGVGAPTSPDAWAARACALHLFGCVRDAETLPELLLPGFEEAALSGLAATSASLPPLLTPSQGQASGAAATAAVTATATTGVFGAASSLPEEEVQQTHPSHASQEASAGAGASLSGGSPAFGCEESLRLTAEAAQLQAVCGAGSSAVFCGGVGSLLGGDGFSASAAGGLLTQSLTPALSAAVETQPSSCFLGQPVADPLLCAAAAHSLPETDAASAAASSGQSFERLTSQLLSSIAGMKELLLRDRGPDAGDLLVEASAQLDVHLANASNSATELQQLLREDLLASQNLAPLIEAAQEQQRKIVRLHSHMLKHHPAYAELLRQDSRLGQWISELQTMHGEDEGTAAPNPEAEAAADTTAAAEEEGDAQEAAKAEAQQLETETETRTPTDTGVVEGEEVQREAFPRRCVKTEPTYAEAS